MEKQNKQLHKDQSLYYMPVSIRFYQDILKSYKFKKPLIVNIHTNRLYWHTGAGVDDENVFDRLKDEKNKLDKDGEKVFNKTYIQVEKLFKDIINEK